MARMVIEASGPDLSLDHWTIHDMPQSGLVQEYMLRMTAGQSGVNIVSSRQLPRGGLSTGKEMAAFFEAPPKTPQISLVACSSGTWRSLLRISSQTLRTTGSKTSTLASARSGKSFPLSGTTSRLCRNGAGSVTSPMGAKESLCSS